MKAGAETWIWLVTLQSGWITWVFALKAAVHSHLPLKCRPFSSGPLAHWAASTPRRRLVAQIKRADVFPWRRNRWDTLPLNSSGAQRGHRCAGAQSTWGPWRSHHRSAPLCLSRARFTFHRFRGSQSHRALSRRHHSSDWPRRLLFSWSINCHLLFVMCTAVTYWNMLPCYQNTVIQK